MKIDKVLKAARKNVLAEYKTDQITKTEVTGSFLTIFGINNFSDGAEWRINSVWHKDTSKGDTEKAILVKFNNGLFNVFDDIRDLKGIEDKVEIFAYLEDLIPDTED